MTPTSKDRAGAILVIDDDDDTRALVREALEGRGYAVLEASNGRMALDLLVSDAGHVPSLMIVDLTMPIMSGVELIGIARNYHRLARIPAIVVSSLPARDAILAEGAVQAWLQKPVDPDQLLAVVSSLVPAIVRTPASDDFDASA